MCLFTLTHSYPPHPYIYIYIYMLHSHLHVHAGYIPTQWTTDAGRLLYKNIYLSLYCKGSKRVTQGLHVRGELETEHNWNILTPKLWSATLCLFRSPLGPHFNQGTQEPLRSGVAIPTTPTPTGTRTKLAWLLSCLSYIIVQRPLDRPRDLWNRMFNRHQAEISVMQFRGHSLPVRQPMRV